MSKVDKSWCLRAIWHLNSLRPRDAYMRQYTNHHWFSQWLVAWSAPSHYPNQFCDIVYWTPGNKLQWNFNKNSYIFIEENAFENVVWKMASIFLGLNVLSLSEAGPWVAVGSGIIFSTPFHADLLSTGTPENNLHWTFNQYKIKKLYWKISTVNYLPFWWGFNTLKFPFYIYAG